MDFYSKLASHLATDDFACRFVADIYGWLNLHLVDNLLYHSVLCLFACHGVMA